MVFSAADLKLLHDGDQINLQIDRFAFAWLVIIFVFEVVGEAVAKTIAPTEVLLPDPLVLIPVTAHLKSQVEMVRKDRWENGLNGKDKKPLLADEKSSSSFLANEELSGLFTV